MFFLYMSPNWRQYLFLLLFLGLFPVHLQAQVHKPVLKWKYGGCYNSWCETGWYSSPAVADLDGDGTQEVVASAYSVVALKGSNGQLIWRAASGHDRSESSSSSVGRTWPAVIITDIDDDGELEIVSAHGGGYVSVYNRNGYFKPGWPKRPVSRELRGLSVEDIDRDGKGEVIVTAAVTEKRNVWVYEHDGTLRRGWPQLSNSSGYSYGVFNDNAWVSDLDGDGFKEIIVPSDVHYICAYDRDGNQLPAHDQYSGKGWGKVGLWESQEIELRGWGDCSTDRRERFRTNLAHGAAVAADLDNNGSMEVVVTGNMYDCRYGHPPGQYTPLFIFNSDRSRFHRSGWDWREPARDTGKPLSESYSRIESCQPNPVVADIDGDGVKEILFASYDGKMHCFWLDKQERHDWPYSIYTPSEGFLRMGSEPIVADLDGDSRAEVIFTSWVEKHDSGALRLGKLHILDYRGRVLHEVPLPAPKSSSLRANGALPAPTIANIDDDDDMELVINTIASGFVAYDLPGSSSARIIWRSGRNKLFKEAAPWKFNLPLMVPLLLNKE